MSQSKSHSALSMDINLGGFFREIVEEPLQHHGSRPGPIVQEYVVGLLEDSAMQESAVSATVQKPLAVLLRDALAAEPGVRFDRLRRTGDGILVLGGLYRRRLRRIGVEDGYAVALGQRAYLQANSLLEVPAGGLLIGEDQKIDILGELAYGFRELMVLLRAVADTILARAAQSSSDIARLCELWLSDRSAHLSRLLQAKGVMLDRLGTVPN